MSLGPLEEAEHVIQAITPDKRTHDLLKMAPGESALLLRRRTWSRGLTVTSVRLFHPGQRFSLFGRINNPGSAK